ncbi:MAG: hypothetical protein IPJ71_19755 [Bdellovibrionales bacterium]|nr:hypothetical protein [Bdellovibrionales bacterium]
MKIEKILGTNTDAFQDFLKNLAFRPQLTWHTSVPQVILDTVYHTLEEGHVLKISYRSEAGQNAGQYVDRRVGSRMFVLCKWRRLPDRKGSKKKRTPHLCSWPESKKPRWIRLQTYEKEDYRPKTF